MKFFSLCAFLFAWLTASGLAAPVITRLDPNPVYASATPRGLAILGSGFSKGGVTVTIRNSEGLVKNIPSAGGLNGTFINYAFTANTTSWSVQITNTDGATSAVFPFFVHLEAPFITTISPRQITSSSDPVTFTISGINFAANTVVSLRDTTANQAYGNFTVTERTRTQITLSATFSIANRDYAVFVTNPGDPVPSEAREFAVFSPTAVTPRLDRILPAPLRASPNPRTITLQGAGYGDNPSIVFRNLTTGQTFDEIFPYAGQNSAVSFPFTFTEGSWTAQATNNTGGSHLASNALAFEVGPLAAAPVLNSVAPSAVNFQKKAQRVRLNGTGFTPDSVVLLTGPRGLSLSVTPVGTPTPTSLTFSYFFLQGGAWTAKIHNPGDNGGPDLDSNTLSFNVRFPTATTPVLARIAPVAGVLRSTAPQDLTLYGKGFVLGTKAYAQLFINGEPVGARQTLSITGSPSVGTTLSVRGVFNAPDLGQYTIYLENPTSEFSELELANDDRNDPTAPKITALAPAPLAASGTEQTLTLTGERFPANAILSLRVGNNLVPSNVLLESVSAQSIIFQRLLPVAGNYALELLDPGTGKKTAFTFAVAPDPTMPYIDDVTPAQPVAAAAVQTLTLTGVRFPDVPVVSVADNSADEQGIGGNPAVTLVSASSTKIVVRCKLAVAGPATISVSNLTEELSNAFEFEVLEATAPRLVSVTPAVPLAGPDVQTLTFGGVRLPLGIPVLKDAAGNEIPLLSSSTTATKIVFAASLLGVGDYTLQVSNAEGDQSAEFTFRVIYGTPPSITSVAPVPLYTSAAPQTLTIRGAAFAANARVTLRNETTGQDYPGLLPTGSATARLTVDQILGTDPGDWSVRVTNPDGQTTVPLAFSVLAPPETPTITAVSPSPVSGALASQPFTITGTKFAAGAVVQLTDRTSGERSLALPEALSAPEITVQAKFGLVSHDWSVAVLNSDGGVTAEFPFTVVAPVGSTAPVIASVTSVTGTNAAQLFTLNGAGFTPGCEITLRNVTAGQVFAARPAKTFAAGQLTISTIFTTAAHDWTVEVTNLSGERSGQFAFSVSNPAGVPAITSVQPEAVLGANGPQDFVINGTGFLATSTVTLRDRSTGQVLVNVPVASRSATELLVRPVFTTAAHRWSAEVLNVVGKKTTASGQYAFEVQTPGGVQPDLTPAITSVVTLFGAGQLATVNWEMTNHGSGNASASTAQIRLSRSGTEILDDDVVLGTVTTPALLAHSTLTQSATVTLPPQTPAGSYSLVVRALQVPNEGKVDNNVSFIPLNITALPAPLLTPYLAAMTPSPVAGSNLTQTVRFSGNNLGKTTKVSFKNLISGKITVRPVKLLANGDVTTTMNFGALATDWTATAVNPGNLSLGALPFNVLDNADGFSLLFPLPGLTAKTAHFASVFDHASRTPYKPGSAAEGTVGVVSFTGERGTAPDPVATLTIKGVPLFSFQKPDGTAFALGGLYDGPNAGKSLSFDSNPGYDYPVAENTSVLATAAGKAYKLNDVTHTIYIDHGNGYRSYYLHCATMVLKNGQAVQAGELLARSGNVGASSFRLRFEVRKLVSGKWVLVDPYGWESIDGHDDPYVLPSIATVDGLNAKLWAP